MVGDDDSGRSAGAAVSCNFFSVDGLDRPALGMLPVADVCRGPGPPPVAVISESLWRSRFASDPRVIGRVAHINNRPVIVTGVVPNRTSGWLRPVSVWMPYTAITYFESSRNLFSQEDYLWLSL